jgi:hypothetical protein
MAGRIYVCEACIEDAALQVVVRENVISERCDYCERVGDTPIACELSDVIERIRFALDQEYNDPVSELPWDSEDGDYSGNTLYIGEVFDEVGFGPEIEHLFDDLCDAFSDKMFCDRDYFGPTPEEYFVDAWNRFKRVVQHQRRYTFWTSIEEGEYGDAARNMSASDMLPQIALKIERVSPVLTLPVGTEMWRVRVHEKATPLTEARFFTSPPVERATQPNRMSPGGIPMFYGTEDFRTAFEETVDPSTMTGKVATGVKFTTLAPLNVLDLTSIKRPRSFFTALDRMDRHAIEFMEAFAEDLSRPIERDERQHIEYVPTQVFTEYIRFELETPDGESYHGIKYASSRNRKPCFVIFADQEDCLAGPTNRPRPQLLQFVDVPLVSVDRLEDCP